MAIKELGYVVIQTTKMQAWDDFLTQIVGVMPAGQAADGAHLYRVDDRPFRFRIVEGAEDFLSAAAYELDSREALNALAERLSAAGHEAK